MKPRNFIPIAALLIALLLLFNRIFSANFNLNQSFKPTPTPSPTPYVFNYYQTPQIANQDHYSLFFIGDSMTKALGPHPYLISKLINNAYPEKNFIIDNYSVGSTNLTTLLDYLSQPYNEYGENLEPLLSRPVDVLVIESFAHNPLSHLPLEEGLQKQRELLTQVMTKVTREKPQTYVIFLATIGPSQTHYARPVSNLTPEQSYNWARERKVYMESFIDFARQHNIPLVDAYHPSLTSNGDLNLDYVNRDDYIHPSEAGVDLISRLIVKHLLENQVLPHS